MATWPFSVCFLSYLGDLMLSKGQYISRVHENKNESWYKGEKAAEKRTWVIEAGLVKHSLFCPGWVFTQSTHEHCNSKLNNAVRLM